MTAMRERGRDEIFTPPWLVNKMLDLTPEEASRIGARFLEPACGTGNFLAEILSRKLAAVDAVYGKMDFERRHFAMLALMNCYGIEKRKDNAAACRARLLEIFRSYLHLPRKQRLYFDAAYVLSRNIVCADALEVDPSTLFMNWTDRP